MPDSTRKSALTVLLAMVSTSCVSTAPDCGCAQMPGHPGCQPPPPPPKQPTASYVLAEAEYGAALGKPRDVEIRRTETYTAKRKGFGTVAVRPPDNCVSQTAAEVQGESRGSSQLASTDCGVWLSEIEKALVTGGFRVVSWDILRTARGVSLYQAARDLGADVLFLFNSLELGPAEAGGESAYRIAYFDSDRTGGRGEPLPMTEAERRDMRAAVMARIDQGVAGGSTTILASTLDATAIVTQTGEAMWFYRNTAINQQSAAAGRAFLFARYSDSPTWYLALPEGQSAPTSSVVAPSERKSAVDAGGASVSAQRDPLAVERLALMRAVTGDFVERFRSGTGGDNE